MSLGQLNTAIRACEAVRVRFSFGAVVVQKASLLGALRERFSARGAETGRALTDDGFLTWDNGDLAS